MGTEIEFKWDANTPRAFYRMRRAVSAGNVAVAAEKMWRITDVYLDTPTNNFAQQQIAFRVRRANNTWEATFKTRTEIKNGKAVRREETLPLSGVKNLTQALAALDKKKKWQGLTLTDLHVLFILKNRRKTHEIISKSLRAELAFDSCELNVCGRKVYFKEIELELKHGPELAFEKLAGRLVQESGLKRARISKIKTALALLDLWGGK